MAHFKADVTGSRGTASRLGGKESGISAHVRGWDNGVRVSGINIVDGDAFRVYATGGSNGGRGERLLGTLHADGTFEAA